MAANTELQTGFFATRTNKKIKWCHKMESVKRQIYLVEKTQTGCKTLFKISTTRLCVQKKKK
jgi:hypothetical protein